VVHSLSPRLHNTAFAELGVDWISVGFPVPAGQVGAALSGAAALGVVGLSVTMPHKEAAAQVADDLSPVAERIGAVNCLIRRGPGWLGDSTDGPGFVAALRRGDRFDPSGQPCLVIGAGGAARAVVAALAAAGAAEVVVVNRSAARAASAAALAGSVGRVGVPEEAAGCSLVVNATPVGMVSHGPWPVDPALLGKKQLVVDLIYHPATTAWLGAARQRGAQVANGLGMLVHQAALQLTAWTGLEAPVEAMWRAVRLDPVSSWSTTPPHTPPPGHGP